MQIRTEKYKEYNMLFEVKQNVARMKNNIKNYFLYLAKCLVKFCLCKIVMWNAFIEQNPPPATASGGHLIIKLLN